MGLGKTKLAETIKASIGDPARFAAGTQFDTEGKTVGYVCEPEMNLVPGIDLKDFRLEFEEGDGKELNGKFRAPHSSSALAVNTFERFRKLDASFAIGAHDGLRLEGFERK